MTRQGRAEFSVRLAKTAEELHAAQRLRYDVFVRELGGGGDLVDHHQKLERDRFDPFLDHMILTRKDDDTVIGVYRLLRGTRAQQAGGFYSENEYDLDKLKTSGRRLLELGRSCLHRDYRGGIAMHCLWAGLADYVAEHEIEILFGVASFHGTDIEKLAAPLSLLHQRHLAPPELRVRVHEQSFQRMDLIDTDTLDRRAAMVLVPSLIKAYLRLGGCVGEGAFIDHEFNTTDVCLIMDTAKLNSRQAKIYGGSNK
ncbi:GNAT family N-acetyltransferase [Sulfitobacter sp. F26169L]|uniref:GNAT family N-acetyltransferase n=1 Tax=Sulfitobacter sp. F26169L TaxID=2996015 RepID=UPI002260864F|nr:GNAT family N-acyltransferase [Sulfitobacter sp. F26169L]MCX7565484.1 GNAT family N-acetyltransferase [Sulfitobacter sp. F26169L]